MIKMTLRNASYTAGAVALGAVVIAGPLIAWRSNLFLTRPMASAAPIAVVSVAASDVGAPKPAASAAIEPTVTGELRPAFDIVRAESSGAAVVAGHAGANVEIELRDDGKVVANAKADETGQFVILPTTFSAGAHQLELTVKGRDGTTAQSSETVAIDIPVPAVNTSIAAGLRGLANRGVTVASGGPATSQPTPMAAVTARSTYFSGKDTNRAKVVRGDSLWAISSHLLGGGEHYPQLQAANAAQIRNPRLIYPGQILVMPGSAPTP